MKRRIFRNSAQLVASLLLAVQLIPLTSNGAPLSKPRPGKIRGQVVDVNKARVVNALVIVDSVETHRQLVTDESGEFEISLRPGMYQIAVDANGFRRFVSAETEIKAGKTRTIEIQLTMASGARLVPAGSD
jgi:uncharacterized membrane protein